eukprot:jgi/Undpi1/2646/HiC_scaffold_13.g06024.m1
MGLWYGRHKVSPRLIFCLAPAHTCMPTYKTIKHIRGIFLFDSRCNCLGDFETHDTGVINFGGDNGNLTPHLDDSLAFVKSGAESGGVLIHCTHGTGRSAAVAIAAAMKAQGDGTPGGVVGGFPEAFRLVKSRRPGTDPPMPFQLELDAWQKEKSKSA